MLNFGIPIIYAIAASMESSNSELCYLIKQLADDFETAEDFSKEELAENIVAMLFYIQTLMVKNHISYDEVEAAFGRLDLPLAED